jgi:hypothetical protein
MRAGSKGQVTAPPLDLMNWLTGRAKRRLWLVGEYMLTPRATVPVGLHGFVRGRPKPEQAS